MPAPRRNGCQPGEPLDPAARLGGETAGVGPPVVQLQPGGRQPAEAGQQLAHGQGHGLGIGWAGLVLDDRWRPPDQRRNFKDRNSLTAPTVIGVVWLPVGLLG
jgi:hypothetical protein